jgi:hypothetical protein
MVIFVVEALIKRFGIDMIDVIRGYFSTFFEKEVSFVQIQLDFVLIFRGIFLLLDFT